MRGYQIADENGVVNFTTVYPGWYAGRAVHIHFKVRTYLGTMKLDEFTSQVFFDDSLTDQVHAQAPYNTRGQRDTRNATDGIFRGTTNSERLLLTVTKTDQGYAASADLGVNLKTPAVSKAVITSNGVVNAGSFQAGVAPGAWITIFGQNLATTARSVGYCRPGERDSAGDSERSERQDQQPGCIYSIRQPDAGQCAGAGGQ